MSKYASYLKRDFQSHRQVVKDLFKRCVRNEESFVRDVHDIRFVWATVRGEFEKHRYVKDLRVAKMLVEEGERRLWLHQHPKPKKFIHSPGGLMFEREAEYPDGLLDYWHPLEKAQFPYYFARREQRKKEFLAAWEKGQKDKKDKAGDQQQHH